MKKIYRENLSKEDWEELTEGMSQKFRGQLANKLSHGAVAMKDDHVILYTGGASKMHVWIKSLDLVFIVGLSESEKEKLRSEMNGVEVVGSGDSISVNVGPGIWPTNDLEI